MKKTLLVLVTLFLGMKGMCQGDLNVQMIAVKAGTFFMGSEDPQYLGKEYDNERPFHRVSVSSYYIAKFEVTNGTWRAVMGVYPPAYTGVDYTNKDCDDCPVVMVNWSDAKEFIRRLNEKTGKNYRLPSEVEWEYAARGGKYSEGFKFAGSNKLNPVGWYGKTNGVAHKVGQKQANELGIFDMSGNVAEWCSDWYDGDYYKNTVDAINPKGPTKGEQRVVRGGSYYDDDAICRNTYRNRMDPDTRRWDIGFRLAMDAPSDEKAKPEEKAK